MKKLELLAPAGNMEALRAAVINGADAVYLGLSDFSARSKAKNFTLDELKNAVEYAHIYGVKVYAAINTLIKDTEMDAAVNLAKSAKKMQIDAIIIQDLGLFETLKKEIPDCELHFSTQAGIHNVYGAVIAQKLGAKRIILSRETTLKDIIDIKNNTDIEIEHFVQGAMCVSFSGNCYFSGVVSSYSGNRGKCMQLCRKKYVLSDGKNETAGYWLSPKDLSLLNNLKDLISAGVTSFKIEGRLRRAEYVAEAVKTYRQAIDSLENFQKNNNDNLKKMFNRGGYCGSHLFEPTANIIYPHLQGHIGLKIGKVKKIIGATAIIESDFPIKKGDGLKYIRENIETGTSLASENENKTTYLGDVQPGDEVYLTSDSALINEIAQRSRKIILNCQAEFIAGQKPKISCSINNIEICVEGDNIVGYAVNAPLIKERITDALQINEDIFKINIISQNIDDNIFVPVSTIKSLRRKFLEEVKTSILCGKTSKTIQSYSTMSDILYENAINFVKLSGEKTTFVQIDNINSASFLLNNFDYIVYNPAEYLLNDCIKFKNKFKDKAILNLPNIARGGDLKVLEEIVEMSGIENYIVNNLYGLELCKGKNIIFGAFFNLLNSKIDGVKISSVENSKFVNNNINYIFGKFPIMTFCHCVKKNFLNKCEKDCSGLKNYTLTDEQNNKFTLRRYKIDNCYGQLLNSVPVNNIDIAIEKGINYLFYDLAAYPVNDEFIGNILNNQFFGKFTRGYYGKNLK